MKIYHFIFFFVLTAGILFYPGCAPSSNSVRYGSSSEEKDDDSNKLRYASDETKKKSIDTSFTSSNYDGEDLPLEKNNFDISSLAAKNLSSETNEFTTVKEKMLMEIIKYLNTPYKFGGNSKNGIDCSAFTQTVYNDCISIPLLRTAQDQYSEGKPVQSLEELKFGDLVFFDTRRNVKPGHVGIYLGENLFAHASSKQGVTVSSISEDYYSKRFMGGRRIEELYSAHSTPK